MPSIQITPWEVNGGKGRVQGISVSVHNVLLTFVLCLISQLPLLSLPFLCIPGSPGTSTLNQAEGRGDDLCHQGDREFATILIGAIPPPSLHLVVERWVPGSAGTSFPPAKGHRGSKMHLEYTVLATASLTQLGCWCPSFVLVSWHESS